MLTDRIPTPLALVAVVLIALATAVPQARAQDGPESRATRVRGRVVGVAGQPAAAAQLGIDWSRFEAVPARPGDPDGPADGFRVTDIWKATPPIIADAQGAFSGIIHPWRKKTWLVAWSRDGQQAGWASVSAGDDAALEIRLRRTVRVRGTVDYEGLNSLPEDLNCEWHASDVPDAGVLSGLAASALATDPGAQLAGSSRSDGTFDVRLPEGRFAWDISDQYGLPLRKFVVVTPETPPDLVLPAVHLKPAYMVRNKGRVLDDLPGGAVRGLLPEGANLSALRGKWVFIEFWGYW